jgi:dienelactone hydrolase
MEYGGMPPRAEAVEVETLSRGGVGHWPNAPNLWTCRLHCRGGALSFSFCVRLLFPKAGGPFPAIVNGDGCWGYLTDDIVRRVLDSGCALVTFNRTEMAEDLGYPGVPDKTKRSGGLYDVYPGRAFGALAAWAWGYHRCVDFLYELPFIDKARIAVTGHSRGGKTTLVAGATDSRITLVNDNASCAGGSAAFRYVGHGGETLGILRAFPSWFGPGLLPYLGREGDIPFDQHCLLAAMAPRPLLLTYALDDRWSNPEGMVQCAWAAGEVYRFLGCPERLAFHLRPGAHAHAPEDWSVLLDFIGWQWGGKPPAVRYNIHPYTHLRPSFAWKAPGV